MSRQKGTLSMSSNLEVKASAPLDARYICETLADMTDPSSWEYTYVGMPVYCRESQKVYTLRYPDPTNINNWAVVGTGKDGKDGLSVQVDSVSKQGRENITTFIYKDPTGADKTIDLIVLDGAPGEIGPQGLQGPQGEPGQSFSIHSQYETEEQLRAAHPTGNTGDAYFVGDNETTPDLYVWDDEKNDWNNIGKLVGTQGEQGLPGADGVSPEIVIAENAPQSYKLRITTKDNTFVTPNLKGIDGDLAPIDTISPTAVEPIQSKTLYTALGTKQNSELSSSMSIGGVTADTVEEALTALNEKAVDVDTTLDGTSDNPVANSAVVSGLADKQGVDLSSPVTIDGVQVDTVEGAISALNTKTVDVDKTLKPSSDNPIANSAVVTGLETKQDKNLSSTIFIDGTAATTVEAGLSTLNTKKVNISDVGSAKGVAELDANGKVPASQLPSFVDDVIDDYFYDPVTEKFYEHKDTTDPDHPIYTDEITPESGKIYIDPDSSAAFRWTGHIYVSVGSANALVLGETSSTAYRGDRGKIAYDTSQENNANIGEMNTLTTTEKGSLVGAINEVNANKVTAISGKGLSTNDYTDADKTAVDSISNKVDKISGKGLSTNDYTDADKDKVDYIDALQPQTISTSITIPDDDPDSDAFVAGESVEGSLLLLGNASTMLRDKKIYAKNIAEEFDSTKNYAIDDYVTYKGRLYKTIAVHTGNWDSSHFEEKQVMDEITAAMVSDYETLQNKPQIAGITLTGNKTYSELGIQQTETGKGLSSNDYTNADKAIVDGVTNALADKVDKVTGKTLSTNDYTDNEKDVVEASATHMSAIVTDTNGVHGLKVTPVTEDEDAIYYKNGNDWKQIQLGAVTQLEEMPTAAAKYSGKIYQFVGTTTQDYKKGYFYECVNASGTYTWQAVRVQAGGGQTIQYDPLPTAEASLIGAVLQYVGTTNANYKKGHFYECVAGETSGTFIWKELDVVTHILSEQDIADIKAAFDDGIDPNFTPPDNNSGGTKSGGTSENSNLNDVPSNNENTTTDDTENENSTLEASFITAQDVIDNDNGIILVDPNSTWKDEPIEWEVIGVNQDGDNTLTLQTKKVLTGFAWNTRNTQSTAKYNRMNCVLLQWLNSDETNWYTSQYGNKSPDNTSVSNYTQYGMSEADDKGFMTNLSSNFKDSLISVTKYSGRRIDYQPDSYEGKMFCLGYKEVQSVPNQYKDYENMAEGTTYHRFQKDNVTDRLNRRIKTAISPATESWWLRTPKSGSDLELATVDESGSISGCISPFESRHGVAPACVIPNNIKLKQIDTDKYEMIFEEE